MRRLADMFYKSDYFRGNFDLVSVLMVRSVNSSTYSSTYHTKNTGVVIFSNFEDS